MQNVLIEENKIFKDILLNEEGGFTVDELTTLLEDVGGEDKQNELIDYTITESFKMLKKRASNIDYSYVEMTKGDVTRLSDFTTIYNSIMFLSKSATTLGNRELVIATSDISNAVSNLKQYKAEFKKAFATGNGLMTMLYNNVTMSIIYATTTLITKCVAITKDSYGLPLSKMESTNVASFLKNPAYKSVVAFNSLCVKGELSVVFRKLEDKNVDIIHEALDLNTLKGAKDFIKWLLSTGTKVSTRANELSDIAQKIGTVLAALGVVFFVCKYSVYYFYKLRIKLSNRLELLSVYLEMNANKQTDVNIKDKQLKRAQQLKSLSERLSVDEDVAVDRQTEREKDDKEIATKIKNREKDRTNNSPVDDDEVLY